MSERLPVWPIVLCALAVFLDGYEAQMLAMAVPLLAYVKTFVQDLNESAETGLRPAGREFR